MDPFQLTKPERIHIPDSTIGNYLKKTFFSK
jgi:hypothetical protein